MGVEMSPSGSESGSSGVGSLSANEGRSNLTPDSASSLIQILGSNKQLGLIAKLSFCTEKLRLSSLSA
ncbi:Uncharacterised protein [Vibrio cholerae]|nr:Uncharacterised protein [Vibrio cholerae]